MNRVIVENIEDLNSSSSTVSVSNIFLSVLSTTVSELTPDKTKKKQKKYR